MSSKLVFLIKAPTRQMLYPLSYRGTCLTRGMLASIKDGGQSHLEKQRDRQKKLAVSLVFGSVILMLLAFVPQFRQRLGGHLWRRR